MNHDVATIRAFGNDYVLHRDILLKSPYFYELLVNQPANQQLVYDVDFKDENCAVTIKSFELAIGHLYGTRLADLGDIPMENLYGLLIVAGLLDLPELFEETITKINDSINSSTVIDILEYFRSHNYGPTSRELFDRAVRFITLNGTDLPITLWLALPPEMLAEILSGDDLFAPQEFDRFKLVVSVYKQKLRARSRGLNSSSTTASTATPSPFNSATASGTSTPRPSTAISKRPNPLSSSSSPISPISSIISLRTIITEHIHYCHMSEQQLRTIRKEYSDVVPRRVLEKHIQLAAQIRVRVDKAKLDDKRLGLFDAKARQTRVPPVRFGASIQLGHVTEFGPSAIFLGGNKLIPCLILAKDEPDGQNEVSLQMCVIRQEAKLSEGYPYVDHRENINLKVVMHTENFIAEKDVELPVCRTIQGQDQRVTIQELENRPIRAVFTVYLM